MQYDAYGRPMNGFNPVPQGNGFQGYSTPPPPPPGASAMTFQPDLPDMAGTDPKFPAWYRMPFFPTAPFHSTNPRTGYTIRYYSGGLLNGTVNTEALVTVQFDLPCRLIAINGAAFSTAAGNALPVGVGPRDCWLFRLEYTTGDKLQISQRLASTVVGSAEKPGELGGPGFTINQGATVTLGITPLIANLRIDVTLHCMEMRGERNFTPPY